MIIQNWDADTGIAQCTIQDTVNNIRLEGYGMAKCHENDLDFKTELTGTYIATQRALIDILRQKRDYDLKPALMALKHLQATMAHSKQYNEKSYEAKRLKKEIKNATENINYINIMIEETQLSLKEYINGKEQVYQELRANNK